MTIPSTITNHMTSKYSRSFICRKNTDGPNPIYSFYDEKDKTRHEAKLPIPYDKVLAALQVGDEFRMKTSVSFTKLKPKRVTKAMLDKIRKETEHLEL